MNKATELIRDTFQDHIKACSHPGVSCQCSDILGMKSSAPHPHSTPVLGRYQHSNIFGLIDHKWNEDGSVASAAQREEEISWTSSSETLGLVWLEETGMGKQPRIKEGSNGGEVTKGNQNE